MPRGTDRWSTVVLAVVLFISYAYFYQAGGWNQNSRFALVRAILERHTLSIDAYASSTGDRAVWQGHYYSDKAPGAAFVALPAVAVARGLAQIAGLDPQSPRGIAWLSYVATVVVSGLFTVAAALAVRRVALGWGYSPQAALFAATAYGVAGPAWCYATLFMGHALSGGCLMLAYAAALDAGVPDARGAPRSALKVGAWIGLAVLTEFPAAIPGLLIAILTVLSVPDLRSRRALAALVAAGGAVSAIVLFAYHTMAFGSPFHTGYASEQGFAGMRMGFFGITFPQGWRLWEILVGRYRGLLPLAPLNVFAPLGLFALARLPRGRRPAAVAGGIVLFYVLLNASYVYWDGGGAYGPRHVMPALPFLALGLAPIFDAADRAGRALLAAGWLWGAALTLIAVSTTPQLPTELNAPFTQLLWPAFTQGDLSLTNQTFESRFGNGPILGRPELHAAWNLGEVAGLRGHASLVPLALVWLVGGTVLWTRLSPLSVAPGKD